MMNTNDSQRLESYVPVYDAAPDTWEEARPFIVENLKKISEAVNIRTIGWYLDEELLSGNSFLPGVNNVVGEQFSENYRTILRKVIVFGTLPSATTKSVPHFITFDANFTLINMYLAATDPVGLKAFALSYWANSAPGSIILNMDANNVNVTTTSNYSAYTRSNVVIEYIQEL